MPFSFRLKQVQRRRILVVFSCLFLSAVAWFFMAMNSKYVYVTKTVMVYKDLPSNRAFHPLQSDTINLKVEGTGWQLFFSRLRIKPPYINVSLAKLNKQNYILFSEQLTSVNKQIDTYQNVISAIPDTLYFDFSKSYEKRIPIKLVSKLTFANQHGLSNEIELKPKYVTVRGPQEELSQLNEWETDTLRMAHLSKSGNFRVTLQNKNSKNIYVFPSNVEVKLPVEEFTEKSIEIPLKIYNNRSFQDVSLYPKKVTVTFLVALSAYKQVDEDFIEAGVDLNDWKDKKHTRLIVYLKRFPEYCKLVKITPSTIDFIIEQ